MEVSYLKEMPKGYKNKSSNTEEINLQDCPFNKEFNKNMIQNTEEIYDRISF